MTRHDEFARLTGIDEPIEIEAVKMLLSQISKDVRNDLFAHNEGLYLQIYKGYVNWLNEEV